MRTVIAYCSPLRRYSPGQGSGSNSCECSGRHPVNSTMNCFRSILFFTFSFGLFFAAAAENTSEAANVTLSTSTSEILAKNSLYNEAGVPSRVDKIRRWVHLQNQCNPNVCFALGGGPLRNRQYKMQKEFVQLVAAVIGGDPTVALSAVRYGHLNTVISRLTPNIDRFLVKVKRSKRRGRFETKIVGSGLGRAMKFCIKELRHRTEDANKIVFFGDGQSDFDRIAVKHAQRFRPPGGRGAICAVGIGLANTTGLTAITGDPTKVLAIDGYFELLDIIEALVRDICLP